MDADDDGLEHGALLDALLDSAPVARLAADLTESAHIPFAASSVTETIALAVEMSVATAGRL